jgi:hypothetical protein
MSFMTAPGTGAVRQGVSSWLLTASLSKCWPAGLLLEPKKLNQETETSSMATLSVLIVSTVELSRVLHAKGVDSIEHELRTVGDAARFMWANFSTRRKGE